MGVISLVDGPFTDDFFPFSLTRSVADIPCGILSIRQKWDYFFPAGSDQGRMVEIPSNILPDKDLARAIEKGEDAEIQKAIERGTRLSTILDVLRLNDREIRNDFELITCGRQSSPLSSSNRIPFSDAASLTVSSIPADQIFIEAGARVEHSMLNVSEGPIYIGKNALVMEGSLIRGPFALGAQSVVKMGARIYGATSVGAHCTVGGEIKNTVLFDYSNKAHDGYLGDSVIGAWCNLGAGTSTSNVKNNAGQVRLWNPLKNSHLNGGQKCGLFMGDYSRSAINTSFNTGTVVGVSANVFGKGLTPSYLSSFSWGFEPAEVYRFEQAIKHIIQWKKLKNETLDAAEITLLKTIFDQQNHQQ
jgi:UDP-N-acetylglucosamine diphosphorylase/glucosamine-1-phosphate N-acetyltransferase